MEAPQEIHVYLNGECKWRTSKPKREVIRQMRQAFNAYLLRECEMSEPKGKRYLKMRFIVLRDVKSHPVLPNRR
jgi:hypothetical protein